VINKLEETWNIVIVAVTLDAGGEALKARKMAQGNIHILLCQIATVIRTTL